MSDQGKVFEVKWRVENLTPWLQTRDDLLCSPQFLAETFANTRWKLRLSRKWHLTEKNVSFSLERDVEDDNLIPIAINYELSFLACDGCALKSTSSMAKFTLGTVSQELKVTGVEILDEKRAVYLPEDVLTVSCKLWRAWSAVSKRGQCLIRSVIGRKCITLDSTIDYYNNLHRDSHANVNFMSTTSEIAFISFDVHHRQNDYMKFQKTEVESKCFSSYSCKLFALKAGGEHLECVNSSYLSTLLSPHEPCSFDLKYYYYNFQMPEYLKNDALTLQLEITYYPGVKSESIEYNYENYKNLSTEPADLEDTSTYIPEKVHSHPLDSLHLTGPKNKEFDIEKNEPNDEVKCFDAARKLYLPSTTLKEDLTFLYESRLFCDTKLQTDEEIFPAHKSILSVRSPVFHKMFTTDMKEKAGESIKIPDISSDTVRRMLQFLYTDSTGDLDMQTAEDLYIASDKYDIVSLKQRCSSYMKKHMCPSNICEVIVLADMHQDKDLESAAHELILTYDKEVFSSNEWKLFMKNFSSLATQVMFLKCMKD